MPRPGPRPYECVRRAWHSDRHQPIRGSLIQEIFRFQLQSSDLSPLSRTPTCIILHSCSPTRNRLILGSSLSALSVWLIQGSWTRSTGQQLGKTRNGRRSYLLLSSELKKSSTPKPIPRYFSPFIITSCFEPILHMPISRKWSSSSLLVRLALGQVMTMEV